MGATFRRGAVRASLHGKTKLAQPGEHGFFNMAFGDGGALKALARRRKAQVGPSAGECAASAFNQA
jgi:hypothetical protein